MKSEDFLPKDLVDAISKQIAAGIKKGAKEGFTAGGFLEDLQDQMEQFTKDQQAYIVNEKVKQKTMNTTLDTREAELDVLQKMAIEQNNSLIKEKIATAERAMIYAQIKGDMQAFYESARMVKDLEKEVGGLEKQNDLINKATEERKKQLKIQIQQEKIQKAEEERSEKIKELEEKRKEALEKIGVNTSLIKDFLQGGVARTLAMTVAAEKMGEAFGEAFKELQGEGLSATQAAHEAMTSFTDSMKTGFLASSEEIRKARAAVMETGGTLHDAEEAGKGAAMMAKVYGGSLEDAGKAIGNLQKIPGIVKESAQNTAEFGAKLAIAAGVPADTATKAIANNMDAVAKAGPSMVKSFQVAAINAKKIGVEFSVITGMADKLLDFENSINAQMEASVLLGREINLDKAREAALSGDYLTVQKEILKQVGSEAEFTRMNVLQKQKLAEAMGVSVADLSKMVKGQGELSDGTKLEGEARSKVNEYLEGGLAFVGKYSGALGGLVGGIISAIPQLMTWNALKTMNNRLTAEGTVQQNINTTSTNTNSLATQRAGLMAKGAATGMLAFGGAVLMIGAGIGAAALGMAQLVKAFGETTNAGYALGAVVAVMAGFVGILYAMTKVLPLLGGAAAVSAGPLLAFGAAVALIGVGIGAAAYGISLMVESFAKMPFENLAMLPLAMMGIGTGLAWMALAGPQAMPIIGMLITLAAVAPALSTLAGALGDAFGGGEAKGGKKAAEEGQFAVLQEGIDKLNTTMTNVYNVISRGGKVVLNAKEVGDALYLYNIGPKG
jgi:hypothetical protein